MATKKTNPVKDARVAYQLIHTMDFNLLRAQKTVLVEMTGKESLSDAERATLEGLLNLIDTIQDLAIDEYGYNKKEVLNLTIGDTEKLYVSVEDCEKIVLADSEDEDMQLISWNDAYEWYHSLDEGEKFRVAQTLGYQGEPDYHEVKRIHADEIEKYVCSK